MIAGYADAIIMRHPREGSARLAAEVAKVPVINGGDGANQHPTQTLLDLFSIAECQGRLEGLSVALVGDLKYGRTVHSLAQALGHFKPRFYFVAPQALAMPAYIEDSLSAAGIAFEYVDSLESVVPLVDILYMTRVQKERFDPTEYMHLASQFILRPEMLKGARHNMRVMHPLPRVDEIHPAVDRTDHAYYFQQAENGVYARQALLSLVMNGQVLEAGRVPMSDAQREKMLVEAIQNGTVIDHIPPGKGLTILGRLQLKNAEVRLTVGLNLPVTAVV